MAEIKPYTKAENGDLPYEEIAGGRFFDNMGKLINNRGEFIHPDGKPMFGEEAAKNREVEELRAKIAELEAERSANISDTVTTTEPMPPVAPANKELNDAKAEKAKAEAEATKALNEAGASALADKEKAGK